LTSIPWLLSAENLQPQHKQRHPEQFSDFYHRIPGDMLPTNESSFLSADRPAAYQVTDTNYQSSVAGHQQTPVKKR